MFVVVVVLASPMTANERRPSNITQSLRHDAELRAATATPTVSSATAPLRRLLSVDSFVGFLHAAQSVAITLLLWITAALSGWTLLLFAGLTRRGRAPPLLRA